MPTKTRLSRRASLQGLCAVGALSIVGGRASSTAGADAAGEKLPREWSDTRRQLWKKVFSTPLVDTHEHLIEEEHRFLGSGKHPRISSDDWSMLFSHYFNADMLSAGMSREDRERFFSPQLEPLEKWRILAPYWPALKHTGYAQASRIAIAELYGVYDLSEKTIGKLQEGYERVRRPGFYREILCERALIASCQVNSLEGTPFMVSSLPTLLMQDIAIAGMFESSHLDPYRKPAGIAVQDLSDWHRVIDWWFATYGPYAVAVKSANAYVRDINYARVNADAAAPLFGRRLARETLNAEHEKRLQDHLFWYAVDAATKAGLPVKLHTGYYSGTNSMPLARLRDNPASACELCRAAPDARFVFMHIGYPYYEEMIALAKQFDNAWIDMCWSLIINPIAAGDFLKKFLMTAPANKLLTFGGDYIPVEPVLGHATMARRGIVLALEELVEEGWIDLDGALALADPIMHGNAERLFNLEAKTKRLSGERPPRSTR